MPELAPLFLPGEQHLQAHVGLNDRIKYLLACHRLPMSSMKIFAAILDDYGTINVRTLYRRLQRLAGSGEITLVSVDPTTRQHFYAVAA